ncbi:MAG TPA: type II secretion system minor pseudopilin GspJ [Burkholderiales bacterium]|nr:type II secretion system minor pseudopilin GspJ [Burkholderiales bacterium]
MKTESGFTLVEILIAIAILALISAMAFRGLSSVIETRRHVAEENRKWHDLSLFFSRFGEDLSRPIHRPATDASGMTLPEFEGKPEYSGPLDANILFTRMGSEGESDERVGYRFNQGKIEELVWAHVDQAPGTKPDVYPLLSRIRSFELRYLAVNNTWVPYWPLPGQVQPKAVEASVTLESGEKIVRIFSLL